MHSVEMVGTGYCGYWVRGSETLRPSTWTLTPILLGIATVGPSTVHFLNQGKLTKVAFMVKSICSYVFAFNFLLVLVAYAWR